MPKLHCCGSRGHPSHTCGHIQDDVSREVLAGIHHTIRQHQPALGISVVDLHGPSSERQQKENKKHYSYHKLSQQRNNGSLVKYQPIVSFPHKAHQKEKPYFPPSGCHCISLFPITLPNWFKLILHLGGYSLSRVECVDVIWPCCSGSDCILCQAEYGMEIVFEALKKRHAFQKRSIHNFSNTQYNPIGCLQTGPNVAK